MKPLGQGTTATRQPCRRESSDTHLQHWLWSEAFRQHASTVTYSQAFAIRSIGDHPAKEGDVFAGTSAPGGLPPFEEVAPPLY